MSHSEKPLFTLVAGPNGSGKTTLIKGMMGVIEFGVYLCPDEVVKEIPDNMPVGERYVRAQMQTNTLRRQCIREKRSHTVETVLSHPSKIDYFQDALKGGFDTQLIFIGLNTPQLNIERVRVRVKQHGHDVSADKIVKRYSRSMGNLPNAIKASGYSLIFDNSVDGHELLLEYDAGKLVLPTDIKKLPEWVVQHIPGNMLVP